MNAIDMQLGANPIAVDGIYVDALGENGRNPVTEH